MLCLSEILNAKCRGLLYFESRIHHFTVIEDSFIFNPLKCRQYYFTGSKAIICILNSMQA